MSVGQNYRGFDIAQRVEIPCGAGFQPAQSPLRERLHRWEAVEKSWGIITSRVIEKNIRWDGVHESYRGFEFHVIRREVWRLQHQRVKVAE